MSKGFRFWTRATLVGTLAVLMTFNPVWAGKGLRGWLKKRAAAKCCEPALTCCPPVAECCEVKCEPVSECEEQICCDSQTVENCVAPECEAAVGVNPSTSQPAESNWTPPANTSPSESPAESSSQTPPPANTFDPPTPPETPSDRGPSIVEKPTEDAGSPSDAAPSSSDVFGIAPPEQTTTPEQPAGDLFDTPAESTPAEPLTESVPMEVKPADATGDLFSEPDTQASDAQAPDTDLFDTPAEKAPIEQVPMEPKTTEPTTDLFSEPATEAPATDLFDTPAVQTPADTNPPTSDLFSPGATSDTEATMPKESAPVDDLFGAPAESTAPGADLFDTPADPAPATQTPPKTNTEPMDDLFGPPSDQPPPTEPATPPKDTDDLFGSVNPIESSSETEATTSDTIESRNSIESNVEAVDESKANDVYDDLFGARDSRIWKDNTGNFEVEAVLVEIHVDKVRLLKVNGKFTSVPMNRLSTSDREFVERVASQLPAGKVKYVAAR